MVSYLVRARGGGTSPFEELDTFKIQKSFQLIK